MSIRESRDSFWRFCQTLAPEFYQNSRWHLRKTADCLQALYEGTPMPDGKVYRKLMMNSPPRHGKSRTLINWCMWCYGKNITNRIITASYGDDLATDFSRYTRDGIREE